MCATHAYIHTSTCTVDIYKLTFKKNCFLSVRKKKSTGIDDRNQKYISLDLGILGTIFFLLSKLLCFHLKFWFLTEETSISLADPSSQRKIEGDRQESWPEGLLHGGHQADYTQACGEKEGIPAGLIPCLIDILVLRRTA